MRVLLVKPTVHPPTIAGSDVAELEPLELEYLATALRDHDVQLFDERFDGDLTAALQRFQPNVVAVTAYSVHYDGALAMLRTAKGLDARVFTVVGGHHATVLPADFERSEVDAIVCGEGAVRDSAQPAGLGIDEPEVAHRCQLELARVADLDGQDAVAGAQAAQDALRVALADSKLTQH